MKHDQSVHHAHVLGTIAITIPVWHLRMTPLGSLRRYLDPAVVKGLPGSVSTDDRLQIQRLIRQFRSHWFCQTPASERS